MRAVYFLTLKTASIYVNINRVVFIIKEQKMKINKCIKSVMSGGGQI